MGRIRAKKRRISPVLKLTTALHDRCPVASGIRESTRRSRNAYGRPNVRVRRLVPKAGRPRRGCCGARSPPFLGPYRPKMGIQRGEARHRGQNPQTTVPSGSTRAQPGVIWLPHDRSQSVRTELYKLIPPCSSGLITRSASPGIILSLRCCTSEAHQSRQIEPSRVACVGTTTNQGRCMQNLVHDRWNRGAQGRLLPATIL